MTVTDTRPSAHTPALVAEVEPSLAQYPGLAGWLSTGDHKTVGRLFVVLGLLGGIFSLVVGALVGFERADVTGIDLLPDLETLHQQAAMYRVGLVFLFALPLIVGLAMYVVPLQVGSPSIAFPRLALASFWTWLVGGGIFIASVFADGGLGRPASGATMGGSEQEAVELTLLALGLVVIAALAATLCIVTTIVALRPSGMGLTRVPLFSWSMLVSGGMWLLTLPVLVANIAIIWVDLRGVTALAYGQPANIYAQLSWVFDQPQIFAFALPVLGIVGDIIPVAFGQRQRLYGVLQFAIGALGFLSFGAFANRYFNPNVTDEVLFVVMGLLLLVPTLVFLGGMADTARRGGRPAFSSQLVLGAMALLLFIGGVVVAVLRVLGPAVGVVREADKDWLSGFIDPLEDLQGTSIISGHLHLVLLTAALGAIAGLYHWGPKVWGRRPSAVAGIAGGMALVGAIVLTSVPDIVSGFLDQPELALAPGDYAGVTEQSTVEAMNTLGAIGMVLGVVGLLLVLLDVLVGGALGRGREAGDDPWGGHTLEWATSSPPPLGNFAAPVAPVTSEAPLIDPADDGGAA
ncbi:MAG: cbb3-type cytochrome c oxidase subunit I [Acidimicrobiales bacterium]|nr:cbb3-type cytochrome c oxidase subunit I [Acidimicrobiales bacterium]